jgi:hypothetical protein
VVRRLKKRARDYKALSWAQRDACDGGLGQRPIWAHTGTRCVRHHVVTVTVNCHCVAFAVGFQVRNVKVL